jgi:hypothetical protein
VSRVERRTALVALGALVVLSACSRGSAAASPMTPYKLDQAIIEADGAKNTANPLAKVACDPDPSVKPDGSGLYRCTYFYQGGGMNFPEVTVSADGTWAEAKPGAQSPAPSSTVSPDQRTSFTQVTLSGSAASEQTGQAVLQAAKAAGVDHAVVLLEGTTMLIQVPGVTTQDLLNALAAAAPGAQVDDVEAATRPGPAAALPSPGVMLSVPCTPALAAALPAAVPGSPLVWSLGSARGRAEVLLPPGPDTAGAVSAAASVCHAHSSDVSVSIYQVLSGS